MIVRATVPPPDTLDALRRLRASPEARPRREAQTRAFVDKILASSAQVIVVHGPADASSLEFVRDWLLPEISARTKTARASEPALAGAGTQVSTLEIWADYMLRGAGSDALSDRLTGLAAAPEPRQRVLLILPETRLGDLFGLRAALPWLLDEMLEMPTLTGAEFVADVERVLRPLQRSFSTELRESLAAELERDRRESSLDANLQCVLAFELSRSFPPGEIGQSDYMEAAGLNGVLLHFLDFCCEQLPRGTRPEVGWALLEHLLESALAPDDLSRIAARFDLPVASLEICLRWFKDQGIVTGCGANLYDVTPAQLREVVRNRRQRLANQHRHTLWVLRQGVRSFLQFGALLSEASFLRVHGELAELPLSEEEAKLMLRCALTYESSRKPEVIAHWSRRLCSDDARTEILLEATFDPRPDVRAAAAHHLGQLKDASVFTHLHLLALRDPVAEVRQAAADGLLLLGSQWVAELETALAQEIGSRASPYRLRAIELLRVCPGPSAVARLETLVAANAPGDDAEARALAIEALARQDRPETAAALLRVGLQDRDEEDREAAARALAATRNEQVVELVLKPLGAPQSMLPLPSSGQTPLQKNVAGFLGAVATLSLIALPSIAAWSIGKRWLSGGLFALQLLGLALIPLGAELAGGCLWLGATLLGTLLVLRELLLERMSVDLACSPYRTWLSRGLFVHFATTMWILPGLASMLTRRFDRGLALLVVAVAGMTMVLISFNLESVFAAYASVSQTFSYFHAIFLVLGLLLVIGAHLLDIVPVFRRAFTAQGRRQHIEKRADRIGTHMLANPLAQRVVTGALAASPSPETSWVEVLLRRRGVRLDLLSLLPSDPATRAVVERRLTPIASARADTDALELLARLATRDNRLARVRHRALGVRVALKLVPGAILALNGLAVPIMSALIALGMLYWNTTPARLSEIVQQQRTGASEPLIGLFESAAAEREKRADGALAKLGKLAQQRANVGVAEDALQELQKLAQADDRYALVALDLLADGVAKGGAADGFAQVGAQRALRLLNEDRVNRDAAVAALEKLRSAGSLDELIRFVDGWIHSPTLPEPADEAVLHKLISMVGSFEVGDLRRLRALERWRASPVLAGVADVSARTFDKVLTGAAPGERATYYAQHGLERTAAADWSAGATDLKLALGVLDDLAAQDGWIPADAVSDVYTLTQTLARYWHETVAPKDPQAYELTHDTMTRLLPFRGSMPKEMARDLTSNLAEAALTMGRFDQARSLAHEAIEQAQGTPGPDVAAVRIAMKYMIFAADVLAGERAAAERSEAALKAAVDESSLVTGWIYDGTRHYLECRAGTTAADKQRLLERLHQVEEKAASRPSQASSCVPGRFPVPG